MTMKEYKYVEVKFEAKGVLFHSASEPKEIINKYAKEGYSYVGFIPTLIDAHGGFRRIDLIFEKSSVIAQVILWEDISSRILG